MIGLESAGVRRGGKMLVENIDLRLERGHVTVIVGPNGAGKSTLMRLMSGEIRPTRGMVSLDARPLAAIGVRELAARRAVLGQANEDAPGFTVSELTALGLRLLPVLPLHNERTALIERALDHVGLAELADRSITTLSGGERQRAHLARVLAQLWAGEALHGPGLLLLDEPIAAQDLAHQLQVLEIARAHARCGGAVALVLHDLNWAARVADRIVVLRRGQIYAEGSPNDVLTHTMLADVFDVDLEPGAIPPADCPFVLPQLARSRSAPRPFQRHTEGDLHVHRYESLQGTA